MDGAAVGDLHQTRALSAIELANQFDRLVDPVEATVLGFAVLAVLSDDYFTVDEDEIAGITAVLTLVGGEPTFAAEEFKDMDPQLPEVSPEWSPVAIFGGYQK